MSTTRDVMVTLTAAVWFVLGFILLVLVFLSAPAPCQGGHPIETHYLGSTFCEPR